MKIKNIWNHRLEHASFTRKIQRLSTDDVQPSQGDDTVANRGASTLIAIVVARLLNCNASEKSPGKFQLLFFCLGSGPAGFFVGSPSEFLHQQKKSATKNEQLDLVN